MRDELKALQEKQAQELKEYQVKRSIIEALPLTVKPDFVYGFNGYKCNGGIKFTVDHRHDIAPLLELFVPVEMVMVKGTFLSFFPVEQLTENDRERNTVTPIAPVIWQAEKCQEYTTQCSFKWYSHFAGILISVQVMIKNDSARFIENHERDHKNRIIRKRWNLQGVPLHGNRHGYSSGTNDSPGNVVIHWDANVLPDELITY